MDSTSGSAMTSWVAASLRSGRTGDQDFLKGRGCLTTPVLGKLRPDPLPVFNGVHHCWMCSSSMFCEVIPDPGSQGESRVPYQGLPMTPCPSLTSGMVSDTPGRCGQDWLTRMWSPWRRGIHISSKYPLSPMEYSISRSAMTHGTCPS